MAFFTPERKKNIEWWKENEKKLALEYDGKHILIYEQKIIAVGNSDEEIFKKAKNLGLQEKSFIVISVGSAIPRETIEM